jgi:hypothetical protein
MGTKPLLFGEFLRNKGLISDNDILVARHVQQETNKQIGELAIKQKMLSAQRVQEILQQQKKSSKKFGEIAIDLKILTRDQVIELLSYQKDFNIHMGEIFKFEGTLSSDDVGKAIEEFAALSDSTEPKKD